MEGLYTLADLLREIIQVITSKCRRMKRSGVETGLEKWHSNKEYVRVYSSLDKYSL